MTFNPINQVRLQSPDGRFFWVPEDKVNEAYRSGLKHADSNAKVPVLDVLGNETEAEANQLPELFSKGYRYKGFTEKIREEVERPIDETSHMNPAERIGTALTGLNPFLIGDVVSGGINRALDSAQGLDVDETNERLRQMRASQPGTQMATGIASQIPLSIMSGGAMTSAAQTVGRATGSKALQYTTLGALGGLEGVAYTAAMNAGEYSLGNPDINAEKLLADAGAGFLWGSIPTLGLGVASDALARKGATGLAQRASRVSIEDSLPKVGMKAIDSETDTVFRNFQIVGDQGEVMGSARIAVKNPESIHQAGRGGVSIEEFTVLPEYANKRVEVAALGQLSEQFGSVHTSSLGNELPESVINAFDMLGVRHVAENGATYRTAYKLPVEKITSADKMIEKYGDIMRNRIAALEDPEMVNIWKKFTNKESKQFRNKVIEFFNDETKGVLQSKQHIEMINDTAKRVRIASEELKTKMFAEFPKENIHKLKHSIYKAGSDLETSIKKLKEIPGAYDNQVIARYMRTTKALKEIENSVEPQFIIKELRRVSQGLGNDIASLKKTPGMHGDNITALSRLRQTIDDDILRNPDVTGNIASNYNRLQKLQSDMIEASKRFEKRYLVNGRVSERRVRSAIRSTDASAAAMRQHDEEVYLQSMRKFLDEAGDQMKTVGLDAPALRNQSIFTDTFIDEMREVRQASKLISSTIDKATTFGVMDAVGQGLFSHLGAAVSSSIGLGWYPGAIAGQQIGGTIRRKLNNPITMINAIENLGSSATNATTRLGKVAEILQGKGKYIVKPAIYGTKKTTQYLGINDKFGEDYPKLYEATNRRLSQVNQDSLREAFAEIESEAPEHADAMARKAFEVSEYIKQNLPAPPRKHKDHREDLMKMQRLVEAAFDPISALETFAQTGAVDGLKHVKALYPHLFLELQSKVLEEVDQDKIDSGRLSKINKLINISKIENSQLTFRDIYGKMKTGGEGGQQPPPRPSGRPSEMASALETETDRLSN